MKKFLLILGIVSFLILTFSLLTSSCKTKEGLENATTAATATTATLPAATATAATATAPAATATAPAATTTAPAATATVPADNAATAPSVSLGAPPNISSTVNAALSQLNTINGGASAGSGSSMPIEVAPGNATTASPTVPTSVTATNAAAAPTRTSAPATPSSVVPASTTPGVTPGKEGFQNLSSPTVFQPTQYY